MAKLNPGFDISPDTIQELCETGLCWHMSHFHNPGGTDEEFDFTPHDWFQVIIITSYDDQVEGWGGSPEEAGHAALVAFNQ